ncbi:HD domain-containing protein [Rubrobacter tropicus]|uniref:HD domain-containing protein n=1 Tax=Rubrobacter tropicus TaxID=2653851 RepID=A0A6G8Q583_9ACTN|nr:HD-GYP domain-containing protein [Rubrobacter tropicus]QIN81626.1 HD domain-containing protein [Rubrobacter tropicus]
MSPQTKRESGDLRFSEVLSALSFALDLVEGQPEGHTVRSCLVGMKVAGRLGLDAEMRSALFYALLLKDAGCSSNASMMSTLFDADDMEAKKKVKTVDWTSLPHAALYAARTVSPDGSLLAKAGKMVRFAARGQAESRNLIRIRCERGADITRLMGFPEETAWAIRSLDEHWDGRGHPDGLKGEEIPLLARICGLAQTVEVFFTAHGPAGAEEVARVRSGRWFDPALVEVLLAEAAEGGLWKDLSREDPQREVTRLEPDDRTLEATPERVDLVARAFGEIIDAKSPFTYRHSEGVAKVAVAMGERAGFGPDATRDLMRAGLLHDIGKLGISNRILDKPGPLTDEEYAKVRRHPELTYEILSRVGPFRPIAETAANHHEKLDGSGYHRGVGAEDLDFPSRILAVADIYDALSADRPYHKALPKEKVLGILREDSGTKLDADSVTILEDLINENAV